MVAKQINIFELTRPKYKIKKPIRLIELFAGIGSQAKALTNIGADFEHYRVVEFDKYAIRSYNAIHNTNFPVLDITKISAEDLGIVDTYLYDYIMTYSFPCQDVSIAGDGKGFKKGSGTRSELLWEVERVLDECKELPQVLLMENVPQVIGSKNFKDFRKWQLKLEKLGYSNYFKLLNAKDYSIPQNRKRCFMVSVLGKHNYRFPKKLDINYSLKDFLRLNYAIDKYWKDALESQPNDTASRKEIWKREVKLVDEIGEIASHTRTITTKQDRSPNAGVIYFDYVDNIKSKFRYLTPRECFLLMGFSEEDFEKVSNFPNVVLYKQAGNSIVVNVLEAIFKELIE